MPIDERADRNPAFDAQRTSANTNDLRGKILRITPKAGGGYTIPEGNLFAPGTPKTRPEIYSMGWRNPFRIEIDPDTDDLWVADYSPDARAANPDRGPAGHGKWAVVDKPSNYGWPYCATAELPYVDYDFATGTSGPKFNCAAPVNDSPQQHRPARAARRWSSRRSGTPTARRPSSPSSRPAASARWPARPTTSTRRPPRARPRRLAALLRRQAALLRVDPRLHQGCSRRTATRSPRSRTSSPPSSIDNPIDMEFGPDGALYVLEYGDGYFAENPDAQLSRIDYVGAGGNHSPVPAIEADADGRALAADRRVLQRRHDRPRRRQAPLRMGLRRRRQGRLRTAERRLHLHRGRHYRATLTVTDQGGPRRSLGRRRHRGRQRGAGRRVRHPGRRPGVLLR